MATLATTSLLSHPDRLFIDGEWVAAGSGRTIDVINPSTEEVFLTVAEAGAADVERAIAAARKAFDHGPWPRMTHAERAHYLRAIGDAMDRRAEDIAQIWPREMGILYAMARPFAGTIGEAYRYYAGLADSFEWEERFEAPMMGGDYALIVNEPVGVVGAIVPWNGPVNIMAYKLAPALIAGCTAVLKMSPEAPGTGYLLAEICAEVGLPAGVLNVVTADREASEVLVRDPRIDKIGFTGSSAVGKRIAGICAERLARCTLELGGKSAALILDDYDVGTAAQSLVGSACAMTGQICSSLTRIVVGADRHDELVDALVAGFEQVRIGDPFDPASGIGPLAMARQRDKVDEMVRAAEADGNRIATGGKRPASLNRGWFFEPTVITATNDDMIAREEIFGPVVTVIKAADEEQAIAIANDTRFGLNNSVFSRDADKAYAIARRLHSGTVGHNAWRSDMSVGFGGFKESGIGREGGVNGLRAYLEPKTIIMDNLA
ncbi:aldehyde dehydrogenase [Novosphingobium colocasiae]|uniref:Aldehyde dehydrogenase n=1 Tax=Novosphingobium colocasiae TaxID=1256513 RepID=A0A918PJI8_9SPHN|nr:aldehyde dehydrogenase [Novosphingobium colocasiae]GGZ13199.1 aldehyde dehydrogenase [Novosphingobium colocasiae]